MTDTETIVDLIIKALGELVQGLDGQAAGPVGPETVIFGRQGLLDSMGLVALIADLEETVETELGVALTLADERALSRTSSPFRTLGSLAAYIQELISGENSHAGSQGGAHHRRPQGHRPVSR
jgi:acyl carrier protein